MVDIRSKASKQRDKGKRRAAENPPEGLGASPTRTSGESSVGAPSGSAICYYLAIKGSPQAGSGDGHKGDREQMKVPDQQPRVEMGSAFEGSARRIVEARQALRKV